MTLTLYHHPFCPLSRAVRIAFGEYGLGAGFIEERVWERRREFLAMNPAGTLPVLQDGETLACGARAIGEYLDETRGAGLGDRRLLPVDSAERAEVRRLLDWFEIKFNEEVTAYMASEKIYKRFMPAGDGSNAPDARLIKAASTNIRYHMRYIGHLAERRNWLAGERFSLADIAAAAQLSVIDYLGDVPWEDFQPAKEWYARVKSRPAFRPLLVDHIAGMPPSRTYVDLDF